MLIYRGSFSVFSTSVGILLMTGLPKNISECILHECGDPILIGIIIAGGILYSPRVWGSYFFADNQSVLTFVFSTSVGIL